jgi:hypothetical protein
VIELTLVVKKSISKKNFEKFIKGDLKIKFEKEVEWDDDFIGADTGNFDGVVINLGAEEMLFVSNDHEWIRRILEEEFFIPYDIHFPEIG